MKKVFASYTFSLLFLILGVVSFSQVSNPSFLAMADQAQLQNSSGNFLIVIGSVCILISVGSLVYKYLSSKR